MTKFVDLKKKHLIYLLDSLKQLSTVDDESMFLRCMKTTAISYSFPNLLLILLIFGLCN